MKTGQEAESKLFPALFYCLKLIPTYVKRASALRHWPNNVEYDSFFYSTVTDFARFLG